MQAGWYRQILGVALLAAVLVGCTTEKNVSSGSASVITQLSPGVDVVTGDPSETTTTSARNTPTSGSTVTTVTTTARTPRSTAIKIMALGDSLTAAGDPSDPAVAQSYRGYLETTLEAAGYRVDFVGSGQRTAIGGTDPDHEGHGGFTIGPDNSKLCPKDATCAPANLDSGLQGWLAAAQPDVVVLLAGVNELFPEDGGVYRPTVKSEAGPKLKALIARIRQLQPDARVVVGSYPPISFLITGTDRADFAALNEAAKSAGSGADKQVVYAPLREKLDGKWLNEDVVSASDQLHPRDTGAKKIAGVFHEALVPVLDALAFN